MNNNKEKISVAMATFNGEKYIKEQIETILENLSDNDELVISDDGSTDNTLDIISDYNDSRIKLISGPKKGIKKNFENAINNCEGDYIFLSDQDDIWNSNKIEEVMKVFHEKNVMLVIHDAKIVDSDNNLLEKSFFSYRNSGKGILKNIIKNTYIGCCMAFSNKLRNKIIPIPDNIEMHDQWIGLISELYGDSYFLNEKLISYRRHENNNSKMQHYKLKKMLKNRIILIFNLIRRKK